MRQKRTRFRRTLPALALGLAAVMTLGLFWGGWWSDTAADPKGPEQVLLDKAIAAMWGQTPDGFLQSVRITSTVSHSDTVYELDTWYQTDKERYREERRHSFGISEVKCLLGDKSWASVDEVVVPLDEAETARLRIQPWLFTVSLLKPLKDTEKFDLEHLGASTLADGRGVERLRVEPLGRGFEIMFEFLSDTWLVNAVTLTDQKSREEMRIELSDYRDVEGIKFAYRIESFRNKKPYATDVLDAVALNVAAEDSLFTEPAERKTDLIIEKNTIDGLMAQAPFDGTDDLEDVVEDLKEWIRDNELEIAGPLVILDPSAQEAPAARTRNRKNTVCIPVSSPTKGRDVKNRDGFKLAHVGAERALCLTHVGTRPNDALLEQLCSAAKEKDLTCTGAARIIHFSLDGKTRQIQIPVTSK